MQLVIYFSGSGIRDIDDVSFGESFYSYSRGTDPIIVAGCQHSEVCNSLLFPDLKGFAKRFTQKMCLTPTDKDFVLGDLNAAKVGILNTMWAGDKITGVTLCGYSRGAVTCFEVARQLNKLVPNMPVDIIADQPVSGNVYQGPGSNAASIADCRDLTNVRNASVILGANTGEFYGGSFLGNLYKKLKHLAFFSQVIPKLPASVKREIIVIPRDNHNEDFSDAHLHMQVAKSLLENRVCKEDAEEDKKDRKYKLSAVENRTQIARSSHTNYRYRLASASSIILEPWKNTLYLKIKENGVLEYKVISPSGKVVVDDINMAELGCDLDGFYALDTSLPRYQERLMKALEAKLPEILKITSERGHTHNYTKGKYIHGYPPVKDLQRIFGMKKEHLYQYTDKLYPSSYLGDGFKWPDYETLVDWWKKHEKKASWVSTALTKRLVSIIQITTDNNVASLKTLFKEASLWLILKENSSSSRYYQVESLRNNIFHRLTTQMGVDKSELIAINYALLKEKKYFLAHWNHASAAASSFKTDATKVLDKAFVAHAIGDISNEDLIEKLDDWLLKKQTSSSKRYNLVIQVREKLQEYTRIEANQTELGEKANGLARSSDKPEGGEANLKAAPVLPQMSEKERLAKMAEISHRAFIDKKEKFLNKADLLIKTIAEKIVRLKPSCKLHEDHLEHIQQLKSQLSNEQSLATNAKRFSHDTTRTEVEMNCFCGRAFGGFKCGCCKGPIYKSETTKTTAVYIPDEDCRKSAREKCILLSAALDVEQEKSSHPPVEYEIRSALIIINQRLRGFTSSILGVKEERALLTLLLTYKQIVNEVESFFSPDEKFIKSNYLPKSDYAQCVVTSIMSRQISRQNLFFQALPDEIQEKIALLTVSSAMPQEDAKYILSTRSKALFPNPSPLSILQNLGGSIACWHPQ